MSLRQVQLMMEGEAWGEQPDKLSEGKVREQVQWFRKQVQWFIDQKSKALPLVNKINHAVYCNK